MKKKVKMTLLASCFFLLFAVIFYAFGLFIPSTPYAEMRQRQVWLDIYENKNEISYVFMGSSHVYCGIDPGLIEGKTGKRTVLIASGMQDLTETYYNLVELLKYQQPETVYIDLYAAYRDFSVEVVEMGNYSNIDCLRLSLNKVRMAKAVFPDEFILYTVFPLLREHSNWKEWQTIEENIEKRKELNLDNYQRGFGGINSVVSDEQYQGYLTMAEDQTPFVMREDDVKALTNIEKLAARKGIAVQYIMIPWLEEFTEKVNYSSILAAIGEVVPVKDYQGEAYMAMELSRETFIADKVSDNQHLNLAGAAIFTEYLLDTEIKPQIKAKFTE